MKTGPRRAMKVLAAAALAWSVGPGVGAQGVAADAAHDTTAVCPDIVVMVPYRPLHTIRGQAVRVGSRGYGGPEKQIGVVRPVIRTPTGYQKQIGAVYGQRVYRSDYGAVIQRSDAYRGVVRVYRAPWERVERSIGVVRPYLTSISSERHPPTTVTNPNAQPNPVSFDSTKTDTPPVTVGPVFGEAPGDGDAAVYAHRPVAEVSEAVANDPWALLNAGLYREARTLFAERRQTNDDAVSRTGQALACALAGELDQAAQLMPVLPVVPADAAFGEATQLRIEQTRQFLFADDPAMQASLQKVIDLMSSPANVSQ